MASVVVAAGAAWCWAPAAPGAARRDVPGLGGRPGDRGIHRTLNNAVSRLNRKLQDGSAPLVYEGRSGYLRSALGARIPVDSQMLVFSQTSFQRKRISETNPRALFFNDRVALGWVRDGELIEVAAQDGTQGIVFYTLDQRPRDERPPSSAAS